MKIAQTRGLQPSAIVLYGDNDETHVINGVDEVLQTLPAQYIFRPGYRRRLFACHPEYEIGDADADDGMSPG